MPSSLVFHRCWTCRGERLAVDLDVEPRRRARPLFPTDGLARQWYKRKTLASIGQIDEC